MAGTAAITRAQYATLVLEKLGITPTPGLVQFLSGWSAAETRSGAGTAQFNPFNDTLKEPGSTNFNTLNAQTEFGVQNYQSLAEGVQATADTIHNGYYPALLAALKGNNLGALGVTTGKPSAGVIANLATWGTKSWQNILANLGAGSQQLIYGGVQPVASTTPIKEPSGSGNSVGSNPLANVPLLGGIYQAGYSVGQSAQTATTSAVTSLGSTFIQALGGKSLQDLSQRAALMSGGVLLIFLGLIVLFFANGGGKVVEAAGNVALAAGTGGTSEAAEGAIAPAEEAASEAKAAGLARGTRRTAHKNKQKEGKA